MSTPSKMRVAGRAAPARRASVGKRSSCETRASEVEAAGMWPGHTARPGSRWPPSHVVVFPVVPPPPCSRCHSPTNGALFPPNSHCVSPPPLSPVKRTSVEFATFSVSRDPTSRATVLSSSRTALP